MVLACDQHRPGVRPLARPCSARFESPGFAYQRPAILVLLLDHQSTADDLAQRLEELGFGPPITAKVRYVLRAMEQEGLVRFSWAAGAPAGTPKPVYDATDHGQRYLRQVTPVLTDYRDALCALVDRYQAGMKD